MARHNLMQGWTWQVTSRPGAQFVTGAAFKRDEPAALPQVTASGNSEADLRLNLVEAAREYERQA
jgi:hypothetical protein